MAVRPEHQKVYQHQIIQSDLTVIVNVLEDHLEEMGPTLDQIADAFADTIPYHGIAVVPDCPYTKLFQRVARDRHSRVVVIRDDCVSPSFLDRFDYRLFQHNVAVGLTVAQTLGIPRRTALRGMLRAHPDPGALREYLLEGEDGPFLLVNAFAANEPSSTLDIWNAVREEHPDLGRSPVIVMNCRPDRVDRTDQFIRGFFSHIPNGVLIAVGEGTRRLTRAWQRGMFPAVRAYYDCEGPCWRPSWPTADVRRDGGDPVPESGPRSQWSLQTAITAYGRESEEYVLGVTQFYLALVIGICLSLLVEEFFGTNCGGSICPGYLAMVCDDIPTLCIVLVIVILVCLIVQYVLSRFMILYGRRKFAVTLCLSVVLKLAFLRA